MSMFCYQCEQTAGGKGCDQFGVCGKGPRTSNLQDLLVYAAEGVSQYAYLAAKLGVVDHEADIAVIEALFTTVTNVNFDPERIAAMIKKTVAAREHIKALYEDKTGENLFPEVASISFDPEDIATVIKKPVTNEDKEDVLYEQATGEAAFIPSGPAQFQPADTLEELTAQSEEVGIQTRQQKYGADVTGLQELLLYGLKGAAAYADHAQILGQEDPEVYAFFHEAMNALAEEVSDVDTLVGLCLRCGEVNLRVMELLDAANTGAYGHPTPTPVRIDPIPGKAILISGHDLKDLEKLLIQTKGTGINIYTHGEMLPAHGYPGLKRYAHLAGNYGGAWQDQQAEFDAFPGSILMTTNCIQKPRDSYKDRIFTCGLVAWPGVAHISDRNFKPVIDAALAAPGFTSAGPGKTILTGFARNAVLGVADKVIEAVQAGAIRHFFLIGGCDGAKSGRNYFTELAEKVPQDCVILTLACGKYRFNKLEFGDIGGIPRLLDVGQCNDAYSAVQIAVALAGAFNCGVNDLPLSMVLSWYEQKAVVILLSLLHLGIRDIRLGPSLPAFITPAVLNVLVEKFNIAPTTTADADLAAILK